MILGSSQNLRTFLSTDVTVNFRGVTLEPCTEAKKLGVIFDRNLSWMMRLTYQSKITRRCFVMLTGLVHLRHYLPASVLSTPLSALVLSHVRYCLTVNGSGSAKKMERVKKY